MNSSVPESSEHAALLRNSVTDFVTRGTDIARVRRMRAAGTECDRALWQRMGKLGWLGILVPERWGGAGLGLAEAAIVAEGLATALTPEPFNAAAVFAATALVHGDNEPLQAQLLETLAEGTLLPALAWQESAGELDVTAIRTFAAPFEGGYKLSGTKRFIAAGGEADGFVVSAQAADGIELYWLPRETAGAEVSTEPLADGRRFGTLALRDALVSKEHRVATSACARAALERARDDATVIAGAELLGIMRRALDISVDYMRTRVQFGKPIGSFQALQHRAVDLYIHKELASAVLEETLRRAADLSDAAARAAAASRVKARCAEAGLRIAREAIQIHGAIGFTDECDIGLFLKRALVLAAWLGSAQVHRRRYAALVPPDFD